MIYRELVALAEREGLLEDTSYEPKEVDYLIHLGPSGRYLGFSAPRSERSPDKQGRPKGEPRPPKRPIPRRSQRAAQNQAEFLVDKAEYVFGIDADSPESFDTPEKRDVHDRRAHARAQLFLEAVKKASESLPGSDDLAALIAFLEAPTPADVLSLLKRESAKDRQAMAGALFAFIYEPDGGAACIHDRPEVKAYFAEMLAGESGSQGQCLVTGLDGVPLTRLHAKPKGIPPLSKTKGGVPLTSVNAAAFVSYGLKAEGGAPISRRASVAIDLALSRLLDRAYPRADGSLFPKRHEVISPDTVVTYWAREDSALDFVAEIEQNDPEAVGELLRKPAAGRPAPIGDPSAFFALVLSGMEGRAIVRSLLESTVRDVAQNVDRYREEVRIVRPYEVAPGSYPLPVLRRSLVSRGDLELLPPALATDLYLCILSGKGFVGAILETIVRRNRIEVLPRIKGTDRRDETALAARCSLLKAFFLRNRKENIAVALDLERRDAPYLLGRLLAVIDRIQQLALDSVNTTLVDRFYGSASSTPQSVLPTLIRRSQPHLSKLRRDKPGAAVTCEKLLGEILDSLTRFPATLSLESQGLFALGFYHQRQALFTKSI